MFLYFNLIGTMQMNDSSDLTVKKLTHVRKCCVTDFKLIIVRYTIYPL
jgi:hypothetical protein